MDSLAINGVNGLTGQYFFPEVDAREIARIARGEKPDLAQVAELRARHRSDDVRLGVKQGVDGTDLSQAGWGVVFSQQDDTVEQLSEALKPLLDLRKQQAGDLYREFKGPDGYKPGESKNRFLARFGVGPGPAVPEKVPYYLMIVAPPGAIGFRFQHLLDAAYAVGRIEFDTMEEYARYAACVASIEKGDSTRSRKTVFFGVQNPLDRATRLSVKHLVKPLAETVEGTHGWTVDAHLKSQATKKELEKIIDDPDKPALLFTASHGVGFPKGHPHQMPYQGALVCQDWGGLGSPISLEDHCFSADDVPTNARINGLMAFLFACYGAGTPQFDDFSHHQTGAREELSSEPFVARLPQRLLQAGALAVVAHVDRAWGCSFIWPQAGPQNEVFRSTLLHLMDGNPVGSAMEFVGERYADLSTLLNDELNQPVPDMSDDELTHLWTANNDAKSYMIVGDPATRLSLHK